MRRLIPLALLLAVPVAACGDDADETTDGTTGDETETSPTSPTTTGPTTTTPGTTTEPGTTTTPGTTTMEETTGTDGTTMEETTAGTTEGTTSMETTTGDTETTGVAMDGWADCFTNDGACIGAETCLIATDPGELQGSFCSVGNCTDVDDCTPAPPTGSATPTCEDVGTDGIAECYLSCANGEDCPTGMECWNTLACVWPETDWTCALSLYDQQGLDALCDCGCGLTDPDCDDMTVGSCETCDNIGSCSGEACPGSIDADDNAACGA